jgi:hypothetical protein
MGAGVGAVVGAGVGDGVAAVTEKVAAEFVQLYRVVQPGA